MKTLWAIPAFLAVTVMAVASPCGTVYFPQQSYGFVQQQKVHHDPYVQKKVVVLEYAFIPTYPIGAAVDYAPATYAPAPQASVAPTPCDAKIAALTATVEELRKQVAGSTTSTPGVPPPGTLPATAPPDKKSVITNECAACHDKVVAANKGKSITLSDGGKVLKADAEMTGKMLRYVASGKCPTGKNLEPERFTAFLQELVDLNSK